MAFDGNVVSSLARELNQKLSGGRIDKIYQPDPDEIIINIRSKGNNHRLLISANSNNPRIYLTEHTKDNPKEPPVFCMLLRKHLSGSSLVEVKQLENDRVLFFNISSKDDLGYLKEKTLIVEIMGRHSNIILIDSENMKIIDSIKRVSHHMSRVRTILPGDIYSPVPSDQVNPYKVNKDVFLSLLEDFPSQERLNKFLYQSFQGFSPLLSKEILALSDLKANVLIEDLSSSQLSLVFENLQKIIEDFRSSDYKFNIYKDDGKYKYFYIKDMKHLEGLDKISFSSPSLMLDEFFLKKDLGNRILERSSQIRRTLSNKLNSLENKLIKQEEELAESENREIYKVYADLISANIHLIQKGSKSVDLDNFYDPNMEKLNIPLDIKLSPAENAQFYYKKYSKLKNASKLLIDHIKDTNDEILYVESVLVNIENSQSLDELLDINEELIDSGYLKSKSKKKAKEKSSKSKPYHFISSKGIDIYVGKNNKQNDKLTLKDSHRDFIWLHVQNMPGSHVIIWETMDNIDEKTLEEAAGLAAYFSKGQNSSIVPVDYTERKNVKKPKASKPGMVTYSNFKTISVKPQEDLVKKLIKK